MVLALARLAETCVLHAATIREPARRPARAAAGGRSGSGVGGGAAHARARGGRSGGEHRQRAHGRGVRRGGHRRRRRRPHRRDAAGRQGRERARARKVTRPAGPCALAPYDNAEWAAPSLRGSGQQREHGCEAACLELFGVQVCSLQTFVYRGVQSTDVGADQHCAQAGAWGAGTSYPAAALATSSGTATCSTSARQ